MKKINIIMTVLITSIFLLFVCDKVNASESSTTKTYNFEYDFLYEYEEGKFGSGVKDYYCNVCIEYTTDEYVLIMVQDVNQYGNSWYVCWYSPLSGHIIRYTSGDINNVPQGVNILSLDAKKCYKDATEYVPTGYSMYGGLSDREYEYVTMIGISDSVMYHYEGDDMNVLGQYIYDGTIAPVMGIDIWYEGNRYPYDSVYSSSIVTPEVRYVMLCWHHMENDYVIDIKFQLPKLTDNTGYYVELWADIPIGYDSSGNVMYTKRMLDIIQVSKLLKQNNVSVADPGGNGMVTQNYGSYYEIYDTWSNLIPYISGNNSIKYNGVILYLRSSYLVSSDKTMVSDYVYFNLDPGKVEKTDDGWKASLPDIYVGDNDNFNENGAGTKKDDDSSITNSSDLEYIGGISSDPGIDKSGNDWNYNFSGNWSIQDLENFVNNGFGLTGNNGLLSLIGNVFYFLPKEFVTVLMFLIGVFAVVAIIKMLG